MNNVFKDLLDVCVTVYLDNILIYSDNVLDHKKHVHDVLCHLHQNSLYACTNKCEFHSESVEYLGYILSPDGLKMSKDKVKTFQDWPEPKKVKDVQSFLGFTNFYCRFIYNYSDIVVLLTCLTRKSAPWNFNEKCCDSFTKLKSAFTSAPILMHWIPDRQIVVETDASNYALAAILSIYSDNSTLSFNSVLDILAQNLMLSLDNGMSTQKGGIMATLQSIHIIFAQSLHKNSYPPPSAPLISLFHPSTQPQSLI
jgi:hypothetical protein